MDREGYIASYFGLGATIAGAAGIIAAPSAADLADLAGLLGGSAAGGFAWYRSRPPQS
jgi:hypothetical protein